MPTKICPDADRPYLFNFMIYKDLSIIVCQQGAIWSAEAGLGSNPGPKTAYNPPTIWGLLSPTANVRGSRPLQYWHGYV